MRAGRFRVALLSILIIAPLTVFLLVATTERAHAAIVEEILPTDDGSVSEGYPDDPPRESGEYYNMYVGWTPTYLSQRSYLRFDLSHVPAGTVSSAVLWLNSKYGPSSGEPDYDPTWHLIDAFGVANDDWDESTITWNIAQASHPPVGSALDIENFQADDFLVGDPRCEDPNLGQLAWYEWDITSYVQSEVAGDKIVSICLMRQDEGAYNSSGWFYTKDAYETQPRVHLRITRLGVGVSISPEEKRGSPGEDVTFIVTVTNETGSEDTFDLSVDSEWPASLSTNVVGPLADGSSEVVALAVTTPEGVIGSENEITITATSQTDPNFYNSKTCTAGSTPIYPTDDAHVINKQASVNFGDEGDVYVGTIIWNLIWENRRGYFKFDLSEIPSGSTIDEAYLSVYTFYGGENGLPYDDATLTVDAREVDNDDWDESTLTWNNAPPLGDILDNVEVPPTDEVRYRFDVTSYAQEQFEGAKVMSIGLISAQEGQNKFTPFSSKEATYSVQKPYLIVYYTEIIENRHDVDVSISPSSQSGAPGDTLSYTVTIKNTGAGYTDTYTLEATDNASWTPSLSEDSVGPLSESASEDVTLSVTIPADAKNGDQDTVTVTATCQAELSVSDSASCIAKCVENIVPGEVEVAIDPTTKSGAPGEQLTYTVTVTNTGDATDTFSVEATDTAEWSPTLSTPTTFSLDAGKFRNLTLRITIPVNAAEGDSMTITVTASGTGYADHTTSTARVAKEEGLPMTLIAIVVVVVIVVVVALMLLRGRKAAPSW